MQDQLIPMKRPLRRLINRSCWSWNQVSEWIFIGISGASETIYSAWWYLGHEGRHSHKIVNNILIEHPLTLQSDSCLSKIVLNQVLSLRQMKSMERMGDCEMELKRKWFLNASWTWTPGFALNQILSWDNSALFSDTATPEIIITENLGYKTDVDMGLLIPGIDVDFGFGFTLAAKEAKSVRSSLFCWCLVRLGSKLEVGCEKVY